MSTRENIRLIARAPFSSVASIFKQLSCVDPEGGRGPDHKKLVSLSNTGPDPLKNYIATKPSDAK